MKLITGNIWSYVNDKIKKQHFIKCAIAYVTSKDLPLKGVDILICDASSGAVASGQTSAEVLEYYFKRGVTIYSQKGLHAKVLHTKDFVVVGSANASKNSASSLIEASLFSVDRTSNNQVNAFIHSLCENKKCLSIDNIKVLKSIPVVKSSFPITRGRTTKTKTYGLSSWIIPVNDISEKVIEQNEQFIEAATNKAAEIAQVNSESISFIHFKSRGTLKAKGYKVGDQFMTIHKSKSSNKITVFSFCPIIKLESKQNELWVFYEISEMREMSWSKFDKKVKNLELKRPIKQTSWRIVDDNDAILISTAFK
jgi:hypothetical protein